MPGYEEIESLKNGGSWGKFWWKTGGFEWVNWPEHTYISWLNDVCGIRVQTVEFYFILGTEVTQVESQMGVGSIDEEQHRFLNTIVIKP